MIHKSTLQALTKPLVFTLISFSLCLPSSVIAQMNETTTDSPGTFIKALQERNAEIDKREEKVEEREDRLAFLKKEVRDMLQKYIKIKEEMDLKESEQVKAQKTEEEKRITRLAKIYQAMKPKEAATRIKKMKKTTALGLLRRIKEKQAAKILSNMSAEKAMQFSESFIKTDK